MTLIFTRGENTSDSVTERLNIHGRKGWDVASIACCDGDLVVILKRFEVQAFTIKPFSLGMGEDVARQHGPFDQTVPVETIEMVGTAEPTEQRETT